MYVYADPFFKVYDPSIGEKEAWYINDHTILNSEDGWHLFGITHVEPANPLEERLCAHAVTKNLLHTPFVKQHPPLQAEHGEMVNLSAEFRLMPPKC